MMMTTRDVMRYLNVPKSSIDYWARIGELPYYQYGKERHFNKNEIERWIKSKRRNGKYIQG